MEHRLKIQPEYFEAVASGEKTFEVRKDDRPFSPKDRLILEEYEKERYTGRALAVTVTYILRGEYCREGYCILGIRPVKGDKWEETGWIPCERELPAPFEPVLVCREDAQGGGVIDLGYWNDQRGWKVYGVRLRRITHWMPLPKPPKEHEDWQ